MEKLEFKIDAEEAGMRIDKCAAKRLGEEYSRTFARMLIDKGHITVNGVNVKPRHPVCEGDEVIVEILPPVESDVKPENIPLDIIYEDERIIVVNKSAGMVVHPGAGNKNGTLVNALLFHTSSLADTGDAARPGIVHRLDKDTSGVVVACKDERALRSISKQFQGRTVKKRYIALVRGQVGPDNGVVEVPLARHAVNRKKMTVDHERGKPARSVYHVKKRFKRFTVLEIELETGRTHQIRLHMKHIGHPVLGDKTYGYGNEVPRQALHAEMVGFTHPDTGKYVEFHSPVPDDIMEVIKRGDFGSGE